MSVHELAHVVSILLDLSGDTTLGNHRMEYVDFWVRTDFSMVCKINCFV